VKIDGRCHCSALAYEAEVDPDAVYLCHCTDCQAISGGSARWAVEVAMDDFRLIAGAPAVYRKPADSGRLSLQHFCGTCAAPLYSYSVDPGAEETPPATVKLRLGTARQRDRLPPRQEYFPGSAQGWARLPRAATRRAGDG